MPYIIRKSQDGSWMITEKIGSRQRLIKKGFATKTEAKTSLDSGEHLTTEED
jgi:hypothetical protein